MAVCWWGSFGFGEGGAQLKDVKLPRSAPPKSSKAGNLYFPLVA